MYNVEMKLCPQCKQNRNLSDFYKDKSRKDLLSCYCKLCIKINRSEYIKKKRKDPVYIEKERQRLHEYYYRNAEKIILKNKEYQTNTKEKVLEYQREYYQENKDKVLTKCKIYRDSHKEEIEAYQQNYADENKEKISKRKKEYRRKNIDKIRARMRKYTREKRASDLQFRLASILRSRINKVTKGQCKAGSAVRDLGCSIKEFKNYIEEQFQSGMTWENYGKWHIDHIKPLSIFDLTDRGQFLEACNYKNLQPMWANDNIRKSNNWPSSSI